MKTEIILTILLLLIQPVTADDWLNIKPDSVFYGLQRAYENIEYRMTFSNEHRSQIALKHAEKRLSELIYAFENNLSRKHITELNNNTEHNMQLCEQNTNKYNILTQQKKELALQNHVKIMEQIHEKHNVTAILERTRERRENTTNQINEIDVDIIPKIDEFANKYCNKDIDISPEINEVVKLSIFNNTGIMWTKTIQVSNSKIDCETNTKPTITMDIDYNTMIMYYNKRLNNEEITKEEVINAYKHDKIKTNNYVKITQIYIQAHNAIMTKNEENNGGK